MAKIKSNYLKLEFDVSSFESTEDGETVQVISHEALENIIHNLVPDEVGVRYELKDMHISRDHCVVSCVITDKKSGRRIQAIGETVPETLESEISKTYPALMAANRAFDRAAIRYLDLPGKTFSSLEDVGYNGADDGTTCVDVSDIPEEAPIVVSPENVGERNDAPQEAPMGAASTEKPTATTQGNSSQQNGATATKPAQAPASQQNAAPAVKPDHAPAPQQNVTPSASSAQQAGPRQGTNHGTPPAQQTAPRQNAAPASQQVTSKSDPGAIICNVGRYYNKNMTIAQVYASDPGHIKWVAEKYSATSAQAAEIRNACKSFLATKEGAK